MYLPRELSNIIAAYLYDELNVENYSEYYLKMKKIESVKLNKWVGA